MLFLKQICLAAIFFISSNQHLISATAFDQHTAMSSNGETIAVWNFYDTLGFDIKAAFLSPNGSWTVPTSLDYSNIIKSRPVVDINNLNHAIVLWAELDPISEFNLLFMKTYNGTSWDLSTTQISATNENVFNDYQVEISDNDWVVITWSSFTGEFNNNLVQSIYGTFGSLNTPVIISF